MNINLGREITTEADMSAVDSRTAVVINDGTVCHVVDTHVMPHPRGFRMASGEMRIYGVETWLPAYVIEVSR